MIESWQAVVLGVVEGVTEYLPVSSTGHLILTEALLGLDQPGLKASLDAFSIVIQGGAILAVLGLYRHRVVQILQGLLGRDPGGLRLACQLVLAFLPSAVLGLLLEHWIDAHLFSVVPVLAALAAGGVWMIWLDRSSFVRLRAGLLDLEALRWRDALTIGLLQAVSLWPGSSRSMMTIAGGTLVGLRRSDAAEFSFLLGLPTLGAACLYKLAKNLHASAQGGTPNLFEQLGTAAVVLGIAVAAVSAAAAMRWFVRVLNVYGLNPFGWYRLALSALLGALVFAGVVA